MTMMELERQRYREGMERGIQQGINQGIKVFVEMSREYGLDDTAIIQSMQDKFGVSLEQAVAYLREYGE